MQSTLIRNIDTKSSHTIWKRYVLIFTVFAAVILSLGSLPSQVIAEDQMMQPMVLLAAQADDAVTGSFASAFFISRGSILGTCIIWFLLAMSMVSFGLIAYLWLNNRRVNILPEGVVEKAQELVKTREYRELINLTGSESSYFSAILHETLKEASYGFNAMVRTLDSAGEEHTTRKFRQIEALNVMGNVAPMIGLFGTVYGMILTFQGIIAAGGRPDPVDLAGGIGTALTTTFWGLVVAIPSLAGYALVRNNIDALTSEATLVAGDIINHFRPTNTTNQKQPAAQPRPTSKPGGRGNA